MADQEQLALLKRGVKEWNQWRDTNSYVRIDLASADLRATRLSRAALYQANLQAARLNGARLPDANLRGACFRGACLRGAHLQGAYLREADLSEADLSEANCRGADLTQADLRGANLTDANLTAVDLWDADFDGAHLLGTIFGGVDLREIDNLDTVYHHGPSTIGIDAIFRSRGQIPENFLRGAGIPECLIDALPALVRRSIDAPSCFICTPRGDEAFAHRLHSDLQREKVRCWLMPEPAEGGEAGDAICRVEKLLLVLSVHTLASSWIPQVVEAAFTRERKRAETILLPLVVDDTVYRTTQAWAMALRRWRPISDFTRWQETDQYQQALVRLLRDLLTPI